MAEILWGLLQKKSCFLVAPAFTEEPKRFRPISDGRDRKDWVSVVPSKFPLGSHLFSANFTRMKSAYELAMERLQKDSPSTPLTPEQRAQIAEIDSLYKAKIAEKELLLKGEIAQERAKGKFEEVEQLEKQLASELRRLNEECESKKEKVRQGKG
jgi:hypothetical protein